MPPNLPRTAPVLLTILRGALPQSVAVRTWTEDVDYREFPLVTLHKLPAGSRNNKRPNVLRTVTFEMVAIVPTCLEDAEDLWEEALEALYDAQRRQVATPNGSLTSLDDTGCGDVGSPFPDTFAASGFIRLGHRAPRIRS